MANVAFTTLVAQEVKTRLMEANDRIAVVYRFIDEIYNDQTCEVLPVLKDAKEAINSVWGDIEIDGVSMNSK